MLGALVPIKPCCSYTHQLLRVPVTAEPSTLPVGVTSRVCCSWQPASSGKQRYRSRRRRALLLRLRSSWVNSRWNPLGRKEGRNELCRFFSPSLSILHTKPNWCCSIRLARCSPASPSPPLQFWILPCLVFRSLIYSFVLFLTPAVVLLCPLPFWRALLSTALPWLSPQACP